MEWEEALGRFTQLQAGPEPAYQASKRLMDAEQALENGPDEKIAPAQGHLKRVRELARQARRFCTGSSLCRRGRALARTGNRAGNRQEQ